MYTEDGFQLADVKGMVRRRWPIAAVVGGFVFLVGVVLAALLPNEFEAAATLLVEPQTVSKSLVDTGSQETDLNERLHLMQMEILSRGRLSRVIDDLGLYPEESENMTREDVIQLMRDHITVEALLPDLPVEPREIQINTFQIKFRSGSRQTAARVANRLSNDFIEQHIRDRVAVSGDTSEFIDNELERISSRNEAVEKRIGAIKSENVGRLPEDLGTNQRKLEHALEGMREAQRKVAEARSDEAFYRQQAALGGEDVRPSGRPDSPAERLQRLQLLVAEYESKGFTEKHPDMLAAREQIEILKSQLDESAAALAGDAEHGDTLTATQMLAQNEAARAGLRAQAAEQEVELLRARVESLEEQLAITPRVAEQLALLEAERDHLRSSYREYSGKRLEATVAADMERRQKGEQFRLLDAAVPPRRAKAPNRPLIVVMGLLMGILLGVGVAVLLEVVDTSFHEPVSVQKRTGLPVLASVPGIVLASDRAAARRRRLLAVTLALGISGAVLLGAGAGYWFVNVPRGSGGDAPAEAEG